MAGGSWGYASKESYLRSGEVLIAVLIGAIIAPLFMHRVWSGLAAMAVLLCLGLYVLNPLAGLL